MHGPLNVNRRFEEVVMMTGLVMHMLEAESGRFSVDVSKSGLGHADAWNVAHVGAYWRLQWFAFRFCVER